MSSCVSQIRTMAPDIAHRISTGQVIASLTSACKELVDNSIDAKSTTIGLDIFVFETNVYISQQFV